MQIVPQSAPISLTSIPAMLLLTAPPPPKLLVAPRIAGLLPATVAPQVEIIFNQPLSLEALLHQLGPIRSLEEMDAEIAGMATNALRKLHDIRTAKGRYA